MATDERHRGPLFYKPEPNLAPLYQWVRERENIRILKDSGADPPWTSDPILATYRFCNVRREDDRGTRWIRQHIREQWHDHPLLWLMLCIARQINWPDTLAELIDNYGAWPSDDTFHPANMVAVMNDRAARGEKVWTGAYMISAPSRKGGSKSEYIAKRVCGALWENQASFNEWSPFESLEDMHTWLKHWDGWGNFMAYQAVVDMRFTRILRDASDIATWAAAGPGTIRGLNRLWGRDTYYGLTQDQARDEMRFIYERVQRETGVQMDFSDVPNILCETDKYLRVLHKEGKPRTLYVPGRGS